MARTSMLPFPVLVLALGVAPLTHAADYLFLGFYDKPGKGTWCADKGMEQREMARKSDYADMRKAFMKAYQGQSASADRLGPESAAVVYRYRARMQGFGCDRDAIAVEKATDIEAAKQRIAERVRKQPKHFLTPPEYVLEWTGSELQSSVTKNYNGVEITFTVSKGRNGSKTIKARGKNTNSGKAAAVSLGDDQPQVVEPGGSFSKTLNSSGSTRVAVELLSPDEQSGLSMEALVQRLKNAVRDEVQEKDGKIESSQFHADGKRG